MWLHGSKLNVRLEASASRDPCATMCMGGSAGSLRSLGRLDLKNITRPVEAFRTEAGWALGTARADLNTADCQTGDPRACRTPSARSGSNGGPGRYFVDGLTEESSCLSRLADFQSSLGTPCFGRRWYS